MFFSSISLSTLPIPHVGGISTGEKRALDLSPPSSSSQQFGEKINISPENKRKCPNPTYASYSSSKAMLLNRIQVRFINSFIFKII